MKRENKTQKIVRAILLPCLFAWVCTACSQEEQLVGGGNGTPAASKEARVNFSIVVPSPVQTLSTKSAPVEGAVNGVFLLLFENKGGARTFRYRIPAENISAVSTTQKTFYANLPKGTYDIVVLANATKIITGSSIAFGDTKEDVLGALIETNTGAWDSETIPMWGKIDNQTIGEGSDFTGQNAIPMVRMVAKIEINVAPEAAGSNNENFKLTDIRLYNYSSKGALVPNLTTWPADNKATAPTEPAGGYAVMNYPNHEPLVFTSGIFYTYEAPAGGKGAAMASNTCLVIGGSYRGGATTYYRVDFMDKNDFLPLLRNHHYRITIQEVVGNGYPTPEIAFETAHSSMYTSVVKWNNSGMEEVVVDDPHLLEVSKGNFTFTNNALTTQTQENMLTIRTSVAGGWVIEKITDQSEQPHTASWLTASETAHAANTPKDIYLFAGQNTTGAERIAYVFIRAGKLSFRVTVAQKNVYDIRITDENGNDIHELVFPFSGGTKTFKVSWTPAAASVSISNTAAGKKNENGVNIAFAGSGLPAGTLSDGSGTHTYTIQATAYTGGDLSMHRASRIDFTINADGQVVSHSIFLRQVDLSLRFVLPAYFLLDGGEKNIGIRSNTRWTVVDVTDNDNVITNKSEVIGKSGGMDTSSEGEKLAFRLENRMSNLKKSDEISPQTATIIVRDLQGAIYNVVINTITAYEVGKLLVWPHDMPNDRTWYVLADVPAGTQSTDIPPLGTRNTTVNPLSCAAIDATNKDLWRLPRKDELLNIFVYFKNNKGYDHYGMENIDSNGTQMQSMTCGYWSSESADKARAYFVGNYNNTQIAEAPAYKTSSSSTGGAFGTWTIHARCVRSK